MYSPWNIYFMNNDKDKEVKLWGKGMVIFNW